MAKVIITIEDTGLNHVDVTLNEVYGNGEGVETLSQIIGNSVMENLERIFKPKKIDVEKATTSMSLLVEALKKADKAGDQLKKDRKIPHETMNKPLSLD